MLQQELTRNRSKIRRPIGKKPWTATMEAILPFIYNLSYFPILCLPPFLFYPLHCSLLLLYLLRCHNYNLQAPQGFVSLLLSVLCKVTSQQQGRVEAVTIPTIAVVITSNQSNEQLRKCSPELYFYWQYRCKRNVIRQRSVFVLDLSGTEEELRPFQKNHCRMMLNDASIVSSIRSKNPL